jgi:hypothetical protein
MRHSKTRKSSYKTKRKTRRTRTRGKVLRGGLTLAHNRIDFTRLVRLDDYIPTTEDFIFTFYLDLEDLYTNEQQKQLSMNEKERLNSLNLYNTRLIKKYNIPELPHNVQGVIESYRDHTLTPQIIKNWTDLINQTYRPFENNRFTDYYVTHPNYNEVYGTDFKVFAYENHYGKNMYYAKFTPNNTHYKEIFVTNNQNFLVKGAIMIVDFLKEKSTEIPLVYNEKAYKVNTKIYSYYFPYDLYDSSFKGQRQYWLK